MPVPSLRSETFIDGSLYAGAVQVLEVLGVSVWAAGASWPLPEAPPLEDLSASWPWLLDLDLSGICPPLSILKVLLALPQPPHPPLTTSCLLSVPQLL